MKPIHHAAMWGDEDEINRLLDENIGNLNVRDDTGKTALHHAVSHNQDTVAKILVDSKADVNALDNNRETPLFATLSARKNWNQCMMEYLISSKADVNAANKKGETILCRAMKNFDSKVVRLLISSNAEVNPETKNKKKRLMSLDYTKCDQETKKLLEEAIRISIISNNNKDKCCEIL